MNKMRYATTAYMVFLGVIAVASLAFYYLHSPSTTGFAVSAISLPGAEARIAALPELVELSRAHDRPAQDILGKLPFKIVAKPGKLVTPAIEEQMLLEGPSMMPRLPQAIVDDCLNKPTRNADESAALIDALLDLGRVDDAVAAVEADVKRNPNETALRETLIDLLDKQNKSVQCIAQIDALFDLLVRQGQSQDNPSQRRQLIERVRALMDRRAAIHRRALLPGENEDAQLKLIDAFPLEIDLLQDLADSLIEQKKNEQVLQILLPRIARYRVDRYRLWQSALTAFRSLGKLDEAARAIELDAELTQDDEIYNVYASVLREANLIDERRSQLLARLQSAPGAATLRDLVLLDLSRNQQKLAAEIIQDNLARISRNADAVELMRLSDLSMRVGLPDDAAKVAIAAAVAGEKDAKILLAVARRLSASSGAVSWPLAAGSSAAFATDFIDDGPGVVGGLVSLGTNKMNARDAMEQMPFAGRAVENKRLAVRLALAASKAADDEDLAYDAVNFAKTIMMDIRDADRVEKLANASLERFGKKQKHAGDLLLWYADAASLRGQEEKQIETLRTALNAARMLGQTYSANEAERRLEKLLLKLQRYSDVLALKWQRVEAYPNDEAAMNSLLSFAEEHKLFGDAERAYRLALKRFDRKTWSDKFARWLLRKERRNDFEKLVAETTEALGESELSAFLQTHVKYDSHRTNDGFYERVHLLALKRFPANVSFNRSLLEFYTSRSFDENGAVPEYLNKRIDLTLRVFGIMPEQTAAMLTLLQYRKMLVGMTTKLEQKSELNPLEAYLWVRVQQMQSKFELAQQGYTALDDYWPRSANATEPLATLSRSLRDSYYIRDPQMAETAADAYGRLADREPLDLNRRTVQGEVLLEAGQPRRMAQTWESIVAVAPGERDRWLHLASLYWDYYLPDQALSTLHEGRERLGDPDLHAIEMAYLLEDQGKIAQAASELVKVAISGDYRSWEARSRLSYLVRAKKTTQEKIDALFWARLTRSDGTSEEGLAYLEMLRNQGESKKAKQAAYRLLKHYQDIVFADGAYNYFAMFGDDAGIKACLDRMAIISERDPAMLRRLAVYHENRNELAEGDKLVTEIAEKADTPYAKQDAMHFAAGYYWRTKRFDKALDQYRAIAENEESREAGIGAWIIYAQKSTDAGKPQQALEALQKLHSGRPTDLELIGAIADAYTALKDNKGLADLYRQALKELRNSNLDRETIKWNESIMRLELIAALTDLGMPRDAVEQHILRINLLAPDTDSVLAAHAYAKQYKQEQPLLAYYEKEVQRAHRDYRWQYVLGLLYEAEGRYAEAGSMLDKAVANEPQRNELLERRAEVLIKAGDFDGAVDCYQTLASRRLAGDYQLRIAEVLYLAGRPAEAEKHLTEVFAADDIDQNRLLAAAQLGRRFGRNATQLLYARRAMERMMAEPDKRVGDYNLFTVWLEAQLDSIGIESTLTNLEQIRANLQQASAQTHPVGRKNINSSLTALDRIVVGWLPQYIGERLHGEAHKQAAVAFGKLLQAKIGFASSESERKNAFENAIRAARMAQLPELAAELEHIELSEQIKFLADRSESDAVNMLRNRLRTQNPADLSAAYSEMAGARKCYAIGYLSVLARAAGDSNTEKKLLEYCFEVSSNTQFGRPQPLTERYLSLLSDNELAAYADGECRKTGWLTYWLAVTGRTELAARSLQHHFKDNEPVWLQAKLARLYQHDPRFIPETRKAFERLLGLPLTIRDHAGTQVPEWQATQQVWTHYAHAYASWLVKQKDDAGLSLLFAEPERHPKSMAAYLQVAAALDEAHRFDEAEDFLARAEVFSTDAWALTLAQARHAVASGDKKEAIRLLDSYIDSQTAGVYLLKNYTEMMIEIGEGDRALDRWRRNFVARLDRTQAYSRRDEFSLIVRQANIAMDENDALALTVEMLAQPAFDYGDLEILAENVEFSPKLRLHMWELALARAEQDERATQWSKQSLAEKALIFAIGAPNEPLARQSLILLAKAAPEAFETYDNLFRLRLQASCKFDKPAQTQALALQIAKKSLYGDTFQNLHELLEQNGRQEAADHFLLAYYDRVELSIEQRIEQFGARLRLKQSERASSLLIELENLIGENAEQLALLADCARKNGMSEAAENLAARTFRLAPNSLNTYRIYTEALLANGKADQAAQLLAEGWTKSIYGQSELDDQLADLARIAADGNSRDWQKATDNLPQPLASLAAAHFGLARKKPGDALDALKKLYEPYELPRITWALYARAARAKGNENAEIVALRNYLRYAPLDNSMAIRLGWLELKKTPFAGLVRLEALNLPFRVWEYTDPLYSGMNPEQCANWLSEVAASDRHELAIAIVNALDELNLPAAALTFGETAQSTFGEKTPSALRKQIASLSNKIEKLRANRPTYFAPNDNLVQ